MSLLIDIHFLFQHADSKKRVGTLYRGINPELSGKFTLHDAPAGHVHDRVVKGRSWANIRERRALLTEIGGCEFLVPGDLHEYVFENKGHFTPFNAVCRLEEVCLSGFVVLRLQAPNFPLHNSKDLLLEG